MISACQLGEKPHNYQVINDTDINPIINPDGTRTTVKRCIDCAWTDRYTRSQTQFEEELKNANSNSTPTT